MKDTTFKIVCTIISCTIILTMIFLGTSKKNFVIQADDIVPAVTETAYSVNATEAAVLLYDYYN